MNRPCYKWDITMKRQAFEAMRPMLRPEYVVVDAVTDIVRCTGFDEQSARRLGLVPSSIILSEQIAADIAQYEAFVEDTE